MVGRNVGVIWGLNTVKTRLRRVERKGGLIGRGLGRIVKTRLRRVERDMHGRRDGRAGSYRLKPD